jgi:hypothetical protein
MLKGHDRGFIRPPGQVSVHPTPGAHVLLVQPLGNGPRLA